MPCYARLGWTLRLVALCYDVECHIMWFRVYDNVMLGYTSLT